MYQLQFGTDFLKNNRIDNDQFLNFPIITMQSETLKNGTISLQKLFLVLLKVGAISFGGNIALISMVQKELVEKYKVVNNEFFLNTISVASLLPGPLAVNVVTYTGYHLKNRLGGFLSMLAVLMPSLVLMIGISWLYFNSSAKLQIGNLMHYIIGTVCGIILSVGVSMFKKELAGNNDKIIFTVIAAIFLFFFNGYFITIVSFIVAAAFGLLVKKNKKQSATSEKEPSTLLKRNWMVLAVLLVIQLLFATRSIFLIKNLYLKIFLVFGGISLSLFGGGYVMIPIMQTLFVNDLQWVSTKEFIDAIAFSQITPGPILISATFIGFKLGGIWGALLATLGIFLPSAVLMIIVASLLQKNKDNDTLRSIMDGIKCVVIGMIIVAAFKILQAEAINFVSVGFFVLSFLLSYFKKISPAYLILATIVIGLLTQHFFSL